MKVLFLNYEYPPLGGGAGNATYYLLHEFCRYSDLQIDLVVSSVGRHRVENLTDSVRVHYLDIKKKGDFRYQSTKDLLTYAWKTFRYARHLSRERHFDICLAFFGIPCGFLAKHLHIPYIVSLRGSDVPFYNVRFHLLDWLLFRFVSKWVWKNAYAVTAISQDLADLARCTAPNQEIAIVHNGVDTREFHPQQDMQSRQSTFNVLFAGRLIERKGVGYLLEALVRLALKYSRIRLVVAGDGPLKHWCENFVREHQLASRVIFLGFVPHSDIARVYQESHVFVLPSLNEAHGNVALEALASGLPIITTKTGASELIDGNGIVVAKRSVSDIACAIERIMTDGDLRLKMAARSRELAKEYSWSDTARQYHRLFLKFRDSLEA